MNVTHQAFIFAWRILFLFLENYLEALNAKLFLRPISFSPSNKTQKKIFSRLIAELCFGLYTRFEKFELHCRPRYLYIVQRVPQLLHKERPEHSEKLIAKYKVYYGKIE